MLAKGSYRKQNYPRWHQGRAAPSRDGGAEARADGHAVQHGPVHAGHPAECLPVFSCRDQADQLLIAQRPPVMSAIEGQVVSRQVGEYVLAGPAVAPQPPAELLDGPKRVVCELWCMIVGSPYS